MGFNYAVVGGGLQGAVIAADLAGRFDTGTVAVVDVRKPVTGEQSPKVNHVVKDVLKDGVGVARIVGEADACVVALPGSIADRALPLLVAAGTPTVDISFTPEVVDKGLDTVARRAGAPLLRDVGVAPGLSHMLAAASAESLGGLGALTILVGGIPQRPPSHPFRHAVYFNPVDLVSEYLRPARMRRHGRPEAPDPLDPREAVELKDAELGQLEAFPSDGLRSLLGSYPNCREMTELTIRVPGHLDEMRRMANAGELAKGPKGKSPADDTAKRLADGFPGDLYPDYLLMEVHAEYSGKHADWRLIDQASSTLTAMSRTTAFTAAAAVHALALNLFTDPGSHPPEQFGTVKPAREAVLTDLRARGVIVEAGAKLRIVGKSNPSSDVPAGSGGRGPKKVARVRTKSR